MVDIDQNDCLTFTGERFLTNCSGEIAYEHWHRYAFARALASGARVLDAACGEGYGTALLSEVAATAVGVDIAPRAIKHAQSRYAAIAQLQYLVASCSSLPFPDGYFNLIVSFETIEHVNADDQAKMVAEFARVLEPGGSLLLSSPNKALYSDEPGAHNDFHLRELYFDELKSLLSAHFKDLRWFRQKLQLFSAIWHEDSRKHDYTAQVLDGEEVADYIPPPALYFIVLARRALPRHSITPLPSLSLFVDLKETVLARLRRAEVESMRLDLLLNERERVIVERDAALDATNSWRETLEGELQKCQTVVVERDSQLTVVNEHVLHLERLIGDRERIVIERDSQLSKMSEWLAQLATTVARCNEEAVHLQELLRESKKAYSELNSNFRSVEEDFNKTAVELRSTIDSMARRIAQLEELLEERESVIAYRQSFRWWLRLPLFRLRIVGRGR